MVATQNGYKVIASNSSKDLTNIKVGSTPTVKIRKGDTFTVMNRLGRELNAGVEKATSFYAWRTPATNKSVGGSPDSNHISGTAIDYNGGKHPNEAAHGHARMGSGWTAAETKAIRTMQKAFLGVIHWGGDYGVGYRDYMHFDIRASLADLKKAAKKTNGGWVTVKVATLNGRSKPSTTSGKVKYKRKKGFRIYYKNWVYRQGRIWLETNYGTWYAAEYTTF